MQYDHDSSACCRRCKREIPCISLAAHLGGKQCKPGGSAETVAQKADKRKLKNERRKVNRVANRQLYALANDMANAAVGGDDLRGCAAPSEELEHSLFAEMEDGIVQPPPHPPAPFYGQAGQTARQDEGEDRQEEVPPLPAPVRSTGIGSGSELETQVVQLRSCMASLEKRLEERQAVEEARIKAEEARERAEERLAAEEARRKAAEERLAAEEARRKAEEERLAAEESRRKAEEAVRLADMQRTVRAAVRARAEKDELAKIAAQALAEAATEKRKREEMEAQIVLCTICQDKKAVYVGVACAHLLFCQDCKDEGLEGVNGKCPICRGHIPAILKVMV